MFTIRIDGTSGIDRFYKITGPLPPNPVCDGRWPIGFTPFRGRSPAVADALLINLQFDLAARAKAGKYRSVRERYPDDTLSPVSGGGSYTKRYHGDLYVLVLDKLRPSQPP